MQKLKSELSKLSASELLKLMGDVAKEQQSGADREYDKLQRKIEKTDDETEYDGLTEESEELAEKCHNWEEIRYGVQSLQTDLK